MNVTIYTTKDCAYCPMVKKYLSTKGVTFTEVDVTDDQAKREEAYNLSGALTVPVTVFERDGKKSVITGWKVDLLAKAIA